MFEDLKQRVWQVAQNAMAEGLVHERGGNFSIYEHDSGCVVMTPHATHRAVLKPENILAVNLNAKRVSEKACSDDFGRPSQMSLAQKTGQSRHYRHPSVSFSDTL